MLAVSFLGANTDVGPVMTYVCAALTTGNKSCTFGLCQAKAFAADGRISHAEAKDASKKVS